MSRILKGCINLLLFLYGIGIGIPCVIYGAINIIIFGIICIIIGTTNFYLLLKNYILFN